MSWHERPMTAFDIESTSADPMTARIVTASVVNINGADVDTRNWLLDPEIDIPAEASSIHGVTTEHARLNGQDYLEGYESIRFALIDAWTGGRTVVAFNASYDLTVMEREGERLGFSPLQPGYVVDPFVIDRAVDKFRRGKRTLAVTCQHYRVPLGDAHNANADALGAARLAWRLAQHPRLQEMTSDELMEQQAAWHRERQDDFAAYKRSRGEDASDINGDWPIRFAGVTA